MVLGSEVVARDVLEYVVFEKHISNVYGQWRIHDKIIPDWMPPRQSGVKTFKIPSEDDKTEAYETNAPWGKPTRMEDEYL